MGNNNRKGRDRRHSFPGRQHRIHIRFDTAEYRDLVLAAGRTGLTVTGFCADAAVAAARGTRAAGGLVTGTAITRHELTALQREIFAARTAVIRTSSSFHQGIAAFQTTGQPPVWLARAADECQSTLRRLDVVADEIDRRLR